MTGCDTVPIKHGDQRRRFLSNKNCLYNSTPSIAVPIVNTRVTVHLLDRNVYILPFQRSYVIMCLQYKRFSCGRGAYTIRKVLADFAECD